MAKVPPWLPVCGRCLDAFKVSREASEGLDLPPPGDLRLHRRGAFEVSAIGVEPDAGIFERIDETIEQDCRWRQVAAFIIGVVIAAASLFG
jgi:hypothetical protein